IICRLIILFTAYCCQYHADAQYTGDFKLLTSYHNAFYFFHDKIFLKELNIFYYLFIRAEDDKGWHHFHDTLILLVSITFVLECRGLGGVVVPLRSNGYYFSLIIKKVFV